MKKVFTILFALFAVLIVSSTNGQNFVQLSKTDAGQTIALAPDQVLEINLPEIPSSGYTWCEATASDNKTISKTIAQIGGSDFIDNPFSGKSIKHKMVGQSGNRIIRYEGTTTGTTELTLALRRPWEKDKPAIDNFTVYVISGGKYTGSYKPPLKQTFNNHKTSTSSSLPSHFDWRPKCTPIANQQQCGDCWAFAGCGVFECNIKITDDSVRDISEEYLTNCDVAYYGCNGGDCPLDYWMPPKGAVYESEDPWTTTEGGGTAGACGGPYVYHETINSWAFVPGENADYIPSDASMKEAIFYYGPIWVAVDASSGAWQSYTSGILTEHNTNTDHAVCLVGWVDSASVSGGGYWILRNSWGSTWGISGYMYISYGSDAVGTEAAFMQYKCKNNDFQMVNVISPVTACGMTNSENVSAEIIYNGCNTIPTGDTLFAGYRADS
ncbi:MAG: C1 family peptidase, partial [Bacteroidales bacterium]